MVKNTLMTNAPLGTTKMYDGKFQSNDNYVQKWHVRTHSQSDHTYYTVW
jgi:hypothetical protein